MKIRVRHIVVFTALLLAALHVAGKNLYVCPDPDRHAVMPGIPGSYEDGIPRFAHKHFKYPLEAWRAQKWYGVEVMALIRTNGHVADFELQTDEEPHPLLLEEPKRVFEKMEWFPASKEGVPVTSWQYFYMPLTRKSSQADCWVPLGLEDEFKLACLYARDWEKPEWDHSPSQMRAALAGLGEAAYLFPAYPPAMIAYGRLLASYGRDNEALSALDACLADYQAVNYSIETDEWGEEKQVDMSPEYNGRMEVRIALVRALLHDMASSSATADAYADAIAIMEKRMIDGYLHPVFTEKDGGGIADLVMDIKRRHDESDTTAIINDIAQEKEAMRRGERATKSDQLNLFGLEAFALWMHGGDEALGEYLARLRAGKPTKKLLKYLSGMEKAMAENSALLVDRREVLRSLAFLVPPEGTDEATANDFHARRKALEKVFPLRWLSD